jgi:flagellar biosynthesis anti-sigma factor FlgM
MKQQSGNIVAINLSTSSLAGLAGVAGNTASGKGGTTAGETTTQAGSSAKSSANDSVSLSSLSSTLSASATSPSESDVNTQRVAQIKSQLANGTYVHNTAKIADGMIDDVKSLLGK